jgi:hypothetical protein
MLKERGNDNRVAAGFDTVAGLAVLAMTWSNPLAAMDEEELLFSDWEQRALAVNAGELRLLDQPPAKPAHQHLNRLVIDADSVATGWVSLEQCHEGLDAVPALEIVFAAGRVRDLAITETRNIGRAWVEDHSVQLEDVGRDSRLCLSAHTLALRPGEQTLALANGPYMRRFLDGYYPMRVQLRVSYPETLLRYIDSTPVTFTRPAPGELLLDVWFEGVLRTTVSFDRL